MALQDTDKFLVNRDGASYKVAFSEVNADAGQAAQDAANALATANQAATDAANAQATADAALPKAGGRMTGAITVTEVEITAGTFDLTSGNAFYCGAITVPNPSGGVAGQTGTIRLTAGPAVWSSNFKFPVGTPPTISAYPAIIPFYVQDATTILMGNVTEGIA